MKVGLQLCKNLTLCRFFIQQTLYIVFFQSLQNARENPIHIINVSIRSADTEDDDALVKAFTAFAQSKVRFCFSINIFQINLFNLSAFDNLQKDILFEYGIRRITFLVVQKVKHFDK